MSATRRRLPAILIPLVIVAAAAAAGYGLYVSREPPSKKARSEPGVAVETVTVERTSHTKDVTASGNVIPARDLDVRPQVSGRIEWLYQSLDPGTFVSEGQTLFRIEAADYRTQVRELEATVKQARAQLEIARTRHDAATEEWQRYGGDMAGAESEPSSLALRKPQLSEAKARLEGAKARLQRARRNLARTRFQAPFDGVLVSSNAEVGQLANAQTPLARLVGTEHFRVPVAVRTDELPHMAVPGIEGPEGSRATIRQNLGDRVVERSGRVLRLLSDRTQQSRMARVLVEIDDPYGLQQRPGPATAGYPILLGSYVEVVIEGRQTRSLVSLPRQALRRGDRAFVVSPDDSRLEVRALTIDWRLPERVLVSDGLSDGERVVISPLATPVDGMKLREVKGEESNLTASRGSGDG
jgi:RND family efflux transporter MFP subunit